MKRFWVKFTSKWSGLEKINSFETESEAKEFAEKNDGQLLNW